MPAVAATVVQTQAPSLAASVAPWLVALVALATLVALLHKLITRDLNRDVTDVRSDVAKLDHKLNGERARINALEHMRTSDVERIVRVETSISGVEKNLERIDKTINDRFDQLAVSIREIRHVEPRRG